MPIAAAAALVFTSFPNVACRSSAKAAASQAPGASVPATAWVSFQDPNEKAFGAEVPQGWTVHGGLFRMGYSDERPMIDITSPDGQTSVRLGDISVPTYAVPTPLHPTEGQIDDLGAQAQLVFASYRTGPQFAVLYARVRFDQTCKSPTADTADVNFSIPDYIPNASSGTQTSTGRIAYSCGSGQKIAFDADRTTLTSAIWSVPTLGSFIAPPAQLALARAVLLHCAQTFKFNPAWLNYQKQMDAYALQYQRARQQNRLAQLAQQQQQFEAQMQAMRNQVTAFENRQASEQAQFQNFDNVLNGVTPTIDPLTGQSKNVWTGPASNYWTNGVGDVVNANGSPGAGWHQLQVTNP
jgi:hypothetical protein